MANGTTIGWAAALALLAGGPALAAKPAPPGAAPAVKAVLDCRAIVDGPARLACFDTAVAAMDTAQTTGDLVTLDKAQRRAARRQAFGLPLPSLAFLDRGERPEEADRIVARVAAARADPYGKWTITLDDGAVWRQIDDNLLPDGPHPGSTAVISRAALGSFFMKIDRQQAIRVHRDR
ncbi:MAG: hypothetical protein ABI376_02075 [Caulobacteraceae bacterium]